MKIRKNILCLSVAMACAAMAGQAYSQTTTITNPETGVGNADVGNSSGNNYEGNTVNLTADPGTSVYGGADESQDVTGNTVEVGVNVAAGDVVGGYSATGEVSGNTVDLGTGFTVTGNVTGGKVGDWEGNANTAGAGTVTGNSVTANVGATQTQVSGDVIGGESAGTGAVTGNEVNLTGYVDIGGNVAGGTISNANSAGEVSGNKVILTGDAANDAEVGGVVAGGHTVGTGTVTANEVELTAADVTGNIAGGYIQNTTSEASATDNKVTLTNSTAGASVFGAVTNGLGEVTGNEVSLSGTTTVAGDVVGGLTDNAASEAAVSANKVNMASGTSAAGDVAGGYNRGLGDVTGNEVTIDAATVGAAGTGNVYGGLISNTVNVDGTVSDNTVTISGATSVQEAVVGGSTDGEGLVTGNSVSIDTGTVLTGTSVGIIGGENTGTGAGNVVGNAVNLTDANISGITGNVTGGTSSGTGAVQGNTVTIADGDASGIAVFGGTNTGGTDSADVSGNTVTITGANTLVGAVTGGSVAANNDANVTDNIINITGDLANAGTGAVDSVTGGVTAGDGDISGNIINVTDATVTNAVTAGTTTGTGNITGNIINLTDATVGSVDIGTATSGNVTDNIVVLDNTTVTGALTGGTTATGTASGNTLNVNGTGNSANSLAGFQVLNFNNLPDDIATTGDAALNVTTTADLDGASVGSISFAGTGTTLSANDEINLITSGGLLNDTLDGTTVQMNQGVSFIYDFLLDTSDGNNVIARFGSMSLNPLTATMATARTASVGQLNRGGNLVADMGLMRMKEAICTGTNVFGAVQGGSQRLGNGAKEDGVSVMLGAAGGICQGDVGYGLGAFFEYGTGDGKAGMGSDVDNDYWGFGVLGNFQNQNGFHGDASIRVGRAETEYRNGDINVGRFGYDIEATYVGAHVTLGYLFNLDSNSTLDVYGRYSFLNIGSDSATIVGDRYKFDSINSHILRAGTRYTYNMPTFSPYIGIAAEYEFDAEQEANVNGVKFRNDDMDGFTGVGEIGITMRPDANTNFSFNLGLEGYVGQRDGFAGIARMNYAF